MTNTTNNGNELHKLIDFDASLSVGQEVWFRFTNNNRYRRMLVKITKLNAQSVRGELVADVQTDLGIYPKGRSLSVPRPSDLRKWSVNNCVENPAWQD